MDDELDFEIDTEALLRTFQVEVDEGLAEMEGALLVLERRPEDTESLGTVFRVVHNIKGNAHGFGLTGLTDFTHRVEEVLDRVRQGELSAGGDLVTLLLRSVDAIRRLVAESLAGQLEMRPSEADFLDELSRVADDPEAAETRREDGPAKGPPMPGQAAGRQAATLRVDLDKLDRLLNLTGEISIARGRLTQMLQDRDLGREEILEANEEHDQLYMELQELVMRVRMVPVGPVFRQQMRAVRDLARERGKLARLELEGEDVEVDTSVIEHLRDPLTHMIRNAVDHGIEPPEVRRGAGKGAAGLLTLGARHQEGTIVIELADDGAGLDRERILRRAIERGLVSEATKPPEVEVDQFIFEPGFSTAETVTDLSGRGVGMDVVRRNVEALRGTVSVASQPGQGTTLTLRLPLTLAIIHGFQVGVGSETYIIPMDAVVETLAFRREERAGGKGRGVINLRGTSLPWVRLRDLLRLGGEASGRECIVVVQWEGNRAGLVVDVLHGESQTVIKPLAKLFRRLSGISGSAILGNGRVALILDVASLLRKEVEQTKWTPGR